MKIDGAKLKEARIKNGLTQKQLGDLCGIADSNIRKYEKNKQNPKFETLKRIAIALNRDVSDFLTVFDVTPELKKDYVEKETVSNLQEYLESIGYIVFREEITTTVKKGYINFELSESQKEMLEKYGYVMIYESPYYIRKDSEAFRLSEHQFQEIEQEIIANIEYQLWKYKIDEKLPKNWERTLRPDTEHAKD